MPLTSLEMSKMTQHKAKPSPNIPFLRLGRRCSVVGDCLRGAGLFGLRLRSCRRRARLFCAEPNGGPYGNVYHFNELDGSSNSRDREAARARSIRPATG